ncbi:hypothetical protein MNEG_7708 [Monoraphidium neglectum]|uniref:MIP18 family-like domain-containing protein n=1 Tax=Monoraphidium neglectum TaxID=145388 RepID=A0A0D2JM25_9CHLO|nr:hypothetical protein MNEG_7708 [Monoraphidium neglectum]KIZ00253.1 hypothetical protein MNEG_7708 [Monoraphidium neglectum]|eukprot:XP_013899272.1 hypothetical protein MNEG_7708 [Monoraphidium neglectum]
MEELINPNPVIHARRHTQRRANGPVASCGSGILDATSAAELAAGREPIDGLEVFEHLRDITDPEHPYTLEQLNVLDEAHIEVDDVRGTVRVQFTPTVEHCSMATLIGLCIRVKLLRCLPTRFKVDIQLSPGSHVSEAAVNKQLNDKERVAAALENPALLSMVDRCLASSDGEGAANLGGGA